MSAIGSNWVTLDYKPWWLSKRNGKDFGTHGYDNFDRDMFGFFIGYGPDFIPGQGSMDKVILWLKLISSSKPSKKVTTSHSVMKMYTKYWQHYFE